MKFIELTLKNNGRKQYVNFDRVNNFCHVLDCEETIIAFDGEYYLHVKESPEEIMSMLLPTAKQDLTGRGIS